MLSYVLVSFGPALPKDDRKENIGTISLKLNFCFRNSETCIRYVKGEKVYSYVLILAYKKES